MKINKGMVMPISLDYVHNAATKNTDFFGKDFLILVFRINRIYFEKIRHKKSR